MRPLIKVLHCVKLLIAFGVIYSTANAAPIGPHEQHEGGPGNIPEDTTTVSIGLTGVTTVDIYCAGAKKRWPKHPQAKGSIQLNLPDSQPPLIAGDGALKVANQWIHNPDPLPQKPTIVTFTCSNSKALAAGVYGFTSNATWAPNPAPCWGTPPLP